MDCVHFQLCTFSMLLPHPLWQLNLTEPPGVGRAGQEPGSKLPAGSLMYYCSSFQYQSTTELTRILVSGPRPKTPGLRAHQKVMLTFQVTRVFMGVSS